jgi:hypothetical protein
VDWETVAVYAVQKPEMARRVAKSLILRFDERIGRPAAVERARNAGEAQEIEAAWKWVDRYFDSRIVPLFRIEQPPHECEPPFESKIALYRVTDTVVQVEPGFTQLSDQATLRLDMLCQWDGTTLVLCRRGLTSAEDGTIPAGYYLDAATLEDALEDLAAAAADGEWSEVFHHWSAPSQKNTQAKMSQNASWVLTYIE